ncbi:sensor histidine kinase [Caproicibacterium sp. NSD3]
MELKKLPRVRKPKKLRTIFIGYLLIFCIVTFLLVALLATFYAILSSTGAILPGYFSETQLSKMKYQISNSETVTPDMIPETCSYAVFSPEGKFLSGDLNPADADQAWKSTQGIDSKTNSINHYFIIPRKNEVCIVRYTYMAQFSSLLLRRFLPYPEILFFILLGIGFLLESFLLASLLGKNMVQKISSLQNATEKIQNQDLEFTVESSGILEIDNVLRSLDKMKETLKASMKKQWRMEKERRKQMSALAHDIKTPLTVVRGNTDLRLKTNQTEEQKEYTAFIQESTHQMEQYLKMLIEISKAETGYTLNKQPINSKSFIDSMYNQILALAAFKKLTIDFNTHNLAESFDADNDLLQRAVLNIASNAVDYSPENAKINLSVEAIGNNIYFCIIDCGKGFSPDALKNAAQQFYMADKSRTSKAHYGMGLFIAKSIVEQHGGVLLLENSEETGGGKVTIKIPKNSG